MILPYVTIMLVVVVGVAVLALDGARFMSLQTQLQNGADALALAGAAELDRLPDSETRAVNAINHLWHKCLCLGRCHGCNRGVILYLGLSRRGSFVTALQSKPFNPAIKPAASGSLSTTDWRPRPLEDCDICVDACIDTLATKDHAWRERQIDYLLRLRNRRTLAAGN